MRYIKYLFKVFTLVCMVLFHSTAFAQEPINIETSWYNYNQNYIAALYVQMNEGYYTYSADYEKFPTSLNFKNSETEILYQEPEIAYDTLTNSTLPLYHKGFYIFLVMTEKPELLNVNLSLLLCSKEHCMPYKTQYTLPEPKNINDLPIIEPTQIFARFEKAKATSFTSQAILLEPTQNEKVENIELLPEFSPRFFVESAEVTSFALAAFFGLLAGLILNLMPCVLPVIAIKITSIVSASSHDPEIRNKAVRQHSFYFALGILTLFSFLAVLVGFFDFMWGQLFQQVFFLVFMCGFMFFCGLCMLGMYTIPMFQLRGEKVRTPRLQAYFQGLVATLIATPCSGPLLGGVLAFSLTLPFYMILLIFLFTGFGMALPYLALTCFPHFVRFVPKAGAWTLIMEKAVGFVFIAIAVYFLSFLPKDLLYSGILYLFLVSFFLWLWTMLPKKYLTWTLASIFFIIHTSFSYFVLFDMSEKKTLPWETYSQSEFVEILGTKPLLVDFTADWCPTCKVLEATVLREENLAPLIEKYNLTLIQVDMTYPDAAQEEFLRGLNSVSIPLLALFPEGIFSYSPIVLRDVFTLKQLEKALEESF